MCTSPSPSQTGERPSGWRWPGCCGWAQNQEGAGSATPSRPPLLPCLHNEASNSCFSGRAVGNSNKSCRSKACVNGIPLGKSEESDILKSYYYIVVKSWDSGVMIPGGKRQILFLGRLLWEETIYRSLSDNSWAVFLVPSASLRLGCLMIHVKVVMLGIRSQLPKLPSAL